MSVRGDILISGRLDTPKKVTDLDTGNNSMFFSTNPSEMLSALVVVEFIQERSQFIIKTKYLVALHLYQ